ncbi:CRR6 family NdhI maturation factor [Coleofasciculus sp. FACHB-SPT36]|uniref:CRR6 family NdhI maturation factor n=1 Tax=Cyanophyceae TaxID=3028117 RepID=UPI00168B14EC|nr:CRR6 family NdhI maturation factor [Coleofasciculus sp. FACHB-SPT36]MBD2541097.1 CRR6 family NdhI maturation factor [Coleofasciculus sp. FACHB-SPT36]
MTTAIALNSDLIQTLDLSPVQSAIEKLLQEGALASSEQQLRFEIDYPREPEDPRELSEIPEVRLWFIRLDAQYPWMPFLLDWKSGELARYTAMLVPHQFNRTEGIEYNPEALEIFVMQKIFVLTQWMKQMGIPSTSRLKSFAKMLGYELDDAFFELIG